MAGIGRHFYAVGLRAAKYAAVLAMTLGLGLVVAAPASANSAYSSKVTYSGSTYLWSYAYISDSTDSNGCGSFNSWARIDNAATRVSSIKNSTTFQSYGLGSLSVGSNVSGTITGSSVTLNWTNTNGATGSYLSGTVCVPFTIVYVGMQAVGTGTYNGTVRVSSTPWL